MKGHKFDWRVKRRPPFCVFLYTEAGEITRREVKMHRRVFVDQRPIAARYWYTKRSHLHFLRFHQRRMYGIRSPLFPPA